MEPSVEDEMRRMEWREQHRSRRDREHEISVLWIEDLPDQHQSFPAPDDALLEKEIETIVDAAIDNLRPLYAAVVRETYWPKWQWTDQRIAAEHGITVGYVRTLRCRARQELRKNPAIRELAGK